DHPGLSLQDLLYTYVGVRLKSSRGIRLGELKFIHKMMWNALQLGWRRLCRADIKTAVYLATVGRNNLRIKPLGQLDSEGRFPDGRRPGYDRYPITHVKYCMSRTRKYGR